MNKIIVDKEDVIAINNNVLDIDIMVEKLTINISGKVVINSVNSPDNLNLVINIMPNSKVIINRFLKKGKVNETIELNQSNNSYLLYNESILVDDVSKVVVDANIDGNNNDTSINVKTVTVDNGKMTIISNGRVKEKVHSNSFLENLRILMLNDKENEIIPNLLVSSNEVVVNHNATISSIPRDYLFYLNSKGISTKESINLISRGYLIDNLNVDEQYKDEIKKLI